MPPLKVACIGEAMVELSLDSANPATAHVGFAGDTLNTAIYLKRCAPQIDVSYVTRLGRDAFSDQMLEFIKGEGLETSLVGLDDQRSVGLYAISTDAQGERSFSYWRSASAARLLFEHPAPDLDALTGFDLVYLSAITLAIMTPAARKRLLERLRVYRSQGGQVAFDSNYRPALWESADVARSVTSAAWALTDIGLPSVDDELALFGDKDEAQVLERLSKAGVRSGALKRGSKGPFCLQGDTNKQGFPAAQTVVDSTAAGDSFNGAYLASKFTGASQSQSLRAGHEMAVRVLGVKGAILPKYD